MSQFANYDEILERLSIGNLWSFPGGVHPQQRKTLSNQDVIKELPLPKALFIPIKQHIGVEGELLVKVGDRVLKGQPLTKSENAFSVPVHASSSGIIKAIGNHPSAHASALPELTVHIELDGKDEALPTKGIKEHSKAAKHDLVNAICNAGISGLGGAGFPTHIKTNNVKPVEFLIINGIECEPYISADDRLMREHAWQIRQGIDILKHLISPKQVIVAIEDNKPEALKTMSIACQQVKDYQVVSVPTKYPAGGEKQLIQVLTSREVPSDGLPIDVGCMMYNVGTCYAISDAIIEGKPLTQRVVTVTGEALGKPTNVWARIGTPVSHLLTQCEYTPDKQSIPRIIMGGPMMGFTLASAKIPVVKITNCILAPSTQELPDLDAERACIRCSACADACPASLLPQQMFWHAKAKEYEQAQTYNLFDCIECGACAYVCPSEIPLVHYYRQAKSEIRYQAQEKEQAEKARIRFEARKERLEREKQEREEKHRLAAEARKQAMEKSGNAGSAQDKIAAALARAKAKKAAKQNNEQANVEANNTSTAKVESEQPSTTSKPTQAIENTVQDETQRQKDSTIKPSTNTNDAKKKRVAAAIAKAKARKQAAQKAKDDTQGENKNQTMKSNTDKPAND